MNYTKDYDSKTAIEWLSLGKWTGFLMRIPIDREMSYQCKDANDLYSIRVRASQLSKSEKCDRSFEVKLDFDEKLVVVTAKQKTNDQIAAN